MDEDTTTIATDDTGAQAAQPVETDTSTAVTEDTASEEQTTEATSEPSEDDQLATWAEGKGLSLDSENTTKAAKMAREAERAMHQKAQRASELERELGSASDAIAENVAVNTGQDPELLKRLQRVEVKEAVRDFWNDNPDARNYEQGMIEEVQRSPHLAGDLRALYAVVKATDTGSVKSQAKREALESLAQRQQAAVPTGNAVNGQQMSTASITPANVDQLVGSHDYQWYEANREAINKAMEG